MRWRIFRCLTTPRFVLSRSWFQPSRETFHARYSSLAIGAVRQYLISDLVTASTAAFVAL